MDTIQQKLPQFKNFFHRDPIKPIQCEYKTKMIESTENKTKQ